MIRPTLIDMNTNELKYYPFIINLNKFNGSCNVLSPKICVPKEKTEISVKVFNVIRNKDEAKTVREHISCSCKCKSNSTTCNSKQKWNNKTCKCEWTKYHNCEKDYSWNPSICICENSKYLKSVVDTSVTKCDTIVTAMNNLSRKKTKSITTNVTSTALINWHR